jgi:glycosyltransferase involved in cell wall biosynthesis
VTVFLLTTIIPFRNAEATVEAAIRSVLRSYWTALHEVKIIAVDDGSVDRSADIVLRLANEQPGIDVVRTGPLGLPSALNAALRRVQSPWFARVDADDLVEEGFIARLLECLGSADVVAVDRIELQADGVTCYFPVDENNLFSLAGAGVALPVGRVLEVGGYADMYWEEFDLYLKLGRGRPLVIRRVAESLYSYFRSPQSVTGSAERRQAGWAELASRWGVHKLTGSEFHVDGPPTFQRPSEPRE